MLPVIAFLLILILVGLLAVVGVLLDIKRGILDNVAEVRELRLTSRTRVAKASVATGVADGEAQLRRLGRVSQSRRVVFGGDDDSQLHKVMSGEKVDTGE